MLYQGQNRFLSPFKEHACCGARISACDRVWASCTIDTELCFGGSRTAGWAGAYNHTVSCQSLCLLPGPPGSARAPCCRGAELTSRKPQALRGLTRNRHFPDLTQGSGSPSTVPRHNPKQGGPPPPPGFLNSCPSCTSENWGRGWPGWLSVSPHSAHQGWGRQGRGTLNGLLGGFWSNVVSAAERAFNIH